jgi:hypothetical protein
LLIIISGLLPTVAVEEAVLRRRWFPGGGNGGDVTLSLGCCEEFLVNHENGLVNFLLGAGAGGKWFEAVCGGG